ARRPRRGSTVQSHRENPAGTNPASTSPSACSRGGRRSNARRMAWVQGSSAAAHKNAFGPASDVGHDRPERETWCLEPRGANPVRCQRVQELGVSSRHLPVCGCVAVELTEQGIAVLLSRISKLLDEAFDLLASGVFEDFGTAEVDGVGFHQFRIESVLADDLAKPVADLVTV